MKKTMTMREALASRHYFGGYLVGESWAAWRALLIAIMGEALFAALTGREREPGEIVREFWGVIGRRGGKSRAVSVLASFIAGCCDHRAVLAPGERGVLPVMAASTTQAQQIFNFIAGVFDSVPRLGALVESRTADTLCLKTGVDVRVRPASARTIRSITTVAAIADEIAFWMTENSVNPDEEILGAIRPSLLTTRGMLVGISSPYSRRGELWKTYRKHYGPTGAPHILVAKASSLTLNPTLPAEDIAQAYEEDPSKAGAEYGGEFRSDIEAFVSREAMEACVDDSVAERLPRSGLRYTGFVDPSGRTGDSMTLAIAHMEDKVTVLDLIREVAPRFNPEDVTADFADDLRRYGIATVVGDVYSGEWVRDSFRRNGIRYEVSDKPKSKLYQDALPLLNARQVQLLDHPRMINQFTNLERRTARGGRDSIDHAPGGHDDVCNAVAGALVNVIKAANVRPARWGFSNHMAR
jgi:hypothetical protein